jgi:hypothetical protein
MVLECRQILHSRITGIYALKEKCINDMIGQTANVSGFMWAGMKGGWD